jgi:hypothetical protein
MFRSDDRPPAETRDAAGRIMTTAAEIVYGLAWVVSGLDFSLPYGFEGKAAVVFAGRFQELKAGVIRDRALVIVDALETAADALVPAALPGRGRLADEVDEGLRVVPIAERETAAASGGIKCPYPTMRYAMEAIDRFVDLMRAGLDRVGAELVLLDGVDQEQVRDWRDRWEDAARDLENVLLTLKEALAAQLEDVQRLDRSLTSIWTRDASRQN